MKLIPVIAIALLCNNLIAQAPPITPKVYEWNSSVAAKIPGGTTRKLFSGSGAILASHQMDGVTLHKGKSITYQSASDGSELFFIIKKGPVSVDLNGKVSELDRGSIVVVLPGDKVKITNNSGAEGEFYEMSYQSIAPANPERGKKAGSSFMMNWSDMVEKKTDKGSTRQLFDRQTTMLNRFDIHVTQLNQGNKSHEPHTHQNEEIILMLDGNAEMQIGTDHQKANGGDVVFMGSNVLHNLTNVGAVPCLYFAIQWN